ncbi:MAG: 1-acyl-sn-glycerol-3-phosphate acyltransferase, partial [Betaproteobacteria bacterium]|nr:1-acyl-sn-glycerol-3-phosphate acyltransferase [Betaproteobacteria bacterium]
VMAVLVTLFYGLFTVPLSILYHDWGYECARSWGRQTLRLAKYLCGLDYRIDGLENIPSQPCVVMAKHQSAWETVAMITYLPRSVWIIKRELLWLPIIGWVLGGLKSIAIDRKKGASARDQILAQGKARLSNGYSVIIFPEGTRIAPGKRGRYGLGGAYLATGAAVPVLPIAHNAGECWRRNAFLKYPGHITLRIGKVIETVGRDAATVTQLTENWIEDEMARLPKAN